MTEKPLAWLGSSLDDVRAFPAESRRAAGYQLLRNIEHAVFERGVYPNLVHASAHGRHRLPIIGHQALLDSPQYEDAVYVIHAFEKRTPQTRDADIALARKRLADFLRLRSQKKEAR
jgi:phage-related protein